MAWLEEQRRGFRIGPEPHHVVPIVPAAVIFDLIAGGDFAKRPDAEFGRRAAAAARPRPGAPGHRGRRHRRPRRGAQGRHRLGQRRAADGGITVAALVVLNSGGSPVDPATGELWGARYGLPGEFATLRRPSRGRGRGVPGHPVAAVGVQHDAGRRRHGCRADQGRVRPGRRRRPRRHGPGDQPDPHLHRRRRRVRAGDRRPPGAGRRRTGGFIRPAVARFAQLAPIIAAAADVVARAIVHAVLAATSAGTMPSYADQLPSCAELLRDRARRELGYDQRRRPRLRRRQTRAATSDASAGGGEVADEVGEASRSRAVRWLPR